MSASSRETVAQASGIACAGPTGDVFKDVSFALQAGTITALVAEPKSSGAKLLDCLAGLSPPSRGSLSALGSAPADWSPEQRKRHVYLRGPARFPFGVKVKELLDQVAMLMDDPGGRKRALDTFGIEDMADSHLFGLDAESQQMVRLAGSLLGRPDLMLYDSLLQGLSPHRAARVREVMAMLREDGKTIVFVADELEPVADLAEQIMILAHGALRAFATPEAILGEQAQRLTVFVRAEDHLDPGAFRDLPFVLETLEKDGGIEFHLEQDPEHVYSLVASLKAKGARLREFRTVRPSLDSAALELMSPAPLPADSRPPRPERGQ